MKVRFHSLEVADWNSEPIRIVFIADIHFAGHHVDSKRVSKIAKTINNQKPDVILIGGDYINGHSPRTETSASFDKEVADSVQAMTAFKAKYGVYTVIGNHDVWYDVNYMRDALNGIGFRVLENHHAVALPGVCITGFADESTQHPSKGLSANCPNGHIVLSIMHSPDTLDMVENADLILAGHTHGGQINIPFIGRRITSTHLGKSYAYGMKYYRGIPVYITSGIGTSILPARFRSRPEVVVIDLK